MNSPQFYENIVSSSQASFNKGLMENISTHGILKTTIDLMMS
jgi:hypothetical protein